MSENNVSAQAKAEFATLCKALGTLEWKGKMLEEDLYIECQARGEDLPMDIGVHIDDERKLAVLFSLIPFTIQDDKKIDMAIAISAINNLLVDGFFDYDPASGKILFRLTNSFMDSVLDEKVYMYMLVCACRTIDEYNDKFLMISKGILSVERFLEMINE